MEKLFIAGIVLYNPSIPRLKENVDSIYSQVSKLLLIDNGSDNYGEIYALYRDFPNIVLCRFNENKGIATAQNKICQYANEQGYKWAITLDQDSVCPQNLVSEYSNYVNDDKVGMLCPRIYDINCGYVDVISNEDTTTEVKDCLASASAIRISAWTHIGGFFEPMFIDKVDFEIAYNLRAHDYKILRVNKVILKHEIGHSVVRHFLFKDRRVFNHNYIRVYYMVRNTFVMIRRYGMERRWLSGLLVDFWSILFYEHDRKRKLRFFLKGLIDGFNGKLGRLQL